jgi:hypothetical protein
MFTFSEFVLNIKEQTEIERQIRDCAQLMSETNTDPYEYIANFLDQLPENYWEQATGWGIQKPQGFLGTVGSAIKQGWQNFTQGRQQAASQQQQWQKVQAVDQNTKQAQMALNNLRQLITQFNVGNQGQKFTQTLNSMQQSLKQFYADLQQSQKALTPIIQKRLPRPQNQQAATQAQAVPQATPQAAPQAPVATSSGKGYY